MDRFLFPPFRDFESSTIEINEIKELKNQLLSLTINYLRYNLFILMTFIVKKLSTAIIIHFMNIF